jgi:NAD(P)-dependent dehydrogenase (short-subunit alcohol dehydrogenase family)
MPIENKVALVTGGARGIGLGIALQLAEAGFTLVSSGRRPVEQAQAALDSIRERSNSSIYVQADVSIGTDRARLLLSVRADILEGREDSFDELIATNLKGPYFLTQAVSAWMIRQRASQAAVHRAIINIGSVSATMAGTNRGDYCISKAGVAMATRLWAARLAEFGIGVYEVRPGIIETDMTAGVREKYNALIESGLLLEKRWGTPEDVGRAVRILATGELSYATGAVLVVDGGLSVERL